MEGQRLHVLCLQEPHESGSGFFVSHAGFLVIFCVGLPGTRDNLSFYNHVGLLKVTLVTTA